MASKIKTVCSGIGTLCLVGYIALLGLEQLGPRKPEVGPLRMKAANEAVSTIVDQLQANRGEVDTVVLLHFAGDPSDYFSDQLRSTLEQRGIFDLQDKPIVEKLRGVAHLREPDIRDPRTAISLAKARGATGVLFGRLLKFESTAGEATLEAEYALVDVTSGRTIHKNRYLKTTSESGLLSPNMATIVRRIPWFQRGLVWMVIILLLPVFTINFIRTMVARRSNSANLFMLAIYTLASGAMAYLLVGAALADIHDPLTT